MYSNIQPFICSNMNEFEDERSYLKENTFVRLRNEFDKLSVNFDPIDINWKETSDYFKSGNVLRLLLHNIQQASPFLICLIGQRYGPHIEKRDGPISLEIYNKLDSYIQRNLLNATQTGYSHLITPLAYNNSFLEFQINAALLNENNYPYYRFYYRQIEYLEDKYMHLSSEERRRAMAHYESENEYCATKIKELKLRIAKKGIVVKYYKSLEQLGQFIYDDYMEMLMKLLKDYFNTAKSKNELRLENLMHNKLSSYILTESLRDIMKKIELFCTTSQQVVIGESSETRTVNENASTISNDEQNQTEEYLEILKLRHLNLANSICKPESEIVKKQLFIIYGSRASGKTSLILQIYRNLNSVQSGTFTLADLPDTLKNRSIASSSTRSLNQQANKPKPLYLFYFLKPQDSILPIIVDITLKIRLKYAKQDCKLLLDNDLSDSKSIIEQFQSSLEFGSTVVFIDGLDDLINKQKLTSWLPNLAELNETKFVLTLHKSSDYYAELISNKSCVSLALNTFKSDKDYHNLFSKILDSNSTRDNNNVLFGKYLSIFNEFKQAHHASNPLYAKLIGQEIFSFDKDIFRPVALQMSARFRPDESVTSKGSYETDEIKAHSSLSYSSMSSSSVRTSTSSNIMENYIEEVSTLRELIQKILKRYIKRNNWSINRSEPVSLQKNCGWVGDALCLIALSQRGLTKSTILRILRQRGYINELEVTDYNWRIFRMTFGFFIQDNFAGVLTYSHQYFKETVQAVLLDGFHITSNQIIDSNLPACRQNISNKQKDIHESIIYDLLQHRIKKTEFDFSSKMELDNSFSDNSDFVEKYIELFHELIYHLYMIYDLLDLCSVLVNFKVMYLFYENRMNYLNEWFDFCNYLKLTSSPTELRSILLSSLTIGVPQYSFEVRQTTLTLKKIPQHELEIHIDKSEYLDTNTYTDKTVEGKPDMLALNQISTNDKLSKNFLEDNAKFKKLIDDLLDLTDTVDLSKEKYGDSMNLILINRALILNDLVKYLDDKFFQDTYSFSLSRIVDNLVSENYPLNGTEQLKYSLLLESIAKMSIKMGDYESALKYFMKCIEILEDLYSTFHLADIDKRYKTKLHFLYIANRLSILHSNMSFLLLKLNNMNGANALLAKSKSFISENLVNIGSSLEFELAIEEATTKYELETKEKYDINNLIYHENVETLLENRKKLLKYDFDDIGSHESLYSYYFIAGIYEVQRMNFYDAYKYFKNALSLSLKWYGKFHLNTCKIYHYFGCFYSLKDIEYYNPRRSELYLRKALFIRDKYRECTNDFKFKNNQVIIGNGTTTSVTSRENFHSSAHLSEYNTSNLYKIYDTTQAEDLYNDKYASNEERNNIAEILFDLGCLLTTYETKLSKKEGIECLRRSHDIKVIILGASHPDCVGIKNRINDLVRENVIKQTRKSSSNSIREQIIPSRNNSSSLSRPATSVKSFAESSPKVQLEKCLKEIRKHADFNMNSNENDDLDKWIKKNSIIELIPSRLDRDTDSNRARNVYESGDLYQSDDDEFVKSFAYNGEANETALGTPTTSSSTTTTTNNKIVLKPVPEKSILIRKKTKSSEAITAKLPLTKSKSAQNLHFRETKRENKVTLHSLNCKCPTALSIDIHNSKTVHGPHSCLNTLLETNSPPVNVQSKILKRIYYKSTWYDIPPGTIGYRFKNFIKIAPNS